MRRVAAVLVLVSCSVFAQAAENAKKKPAPQNVTFGDEQIVAEPKVGYGTTIVTKQRSIFPNLIRVRMDFNDKLLSSVNEM